HALLKPRLLLVRRWSREAHDTLRIGGSGCRIAVESGDQRRRQPPGPRPRLLLAVRWAEGVEGHIALDGPGRLEPTPALLGGQPALRVLCTQLLHVAVDRA